MSLTYDFVIVGGGTNGLSAAAYLGREGYSTVTIERQPYLGGGAVTKEITLPGFKHDVIATSLNIWKASSIQQDLELEKYGYREATPDPVASTPFKNGKAVTMYRELKSTLQSIEQFSKKDAEKYKEIFESYIESKDILLGSLASAPVPFSTMMSTLEESDSGLDFLQFSYMSARDWLEENFESEEVKAFLALWGSNHVPLSPEDAGSAILILIFMGILQDSGAGIPLGGISSLVSALAKYIDAHGGQTIVGEEVIEVLTYDNHATGVLTRNGKIFEARKGVIASVEPKTLFLRLIPDSALDQSFKKKVKQYRYSRVTEVMIHAALNEWFDYRPSEIRAAGLVQIGDSLNQISRAFNDCVIGQTPSEPFMTIDNTTCYDNSRAPPERHIMWNFVRAPVFISGKAWTEDEKETFADRCIERLSNYAPNANRIILKRVVFSPQDIERMAPNLVYGDPCVGKATLDQSLALKPFPGWSEYRTPIKGLYMCSPANHPGGGVCGLAGHNAVISVLKDLGKCNTED